MMTMQLSRRIPGRVKTVTAEWCKMDFMVMSPKYREIRSRSKNPMNACYWCKQPITDGEMMALAHIKEAKGNKVLCQGCARELMQGDGGVRDTVQSKEQFDREAERGEKCTTTPF